ncbi:MAG: CcoQ/FixQ family Cbb3-type cytochrome c oxidase assembly chaperone [Thermaurantimonas sp.]|uniref:CcoQ/FixQ family Cbb3-type cytochrome c oxidase assembly chaperone n=1 Tax=Thermaurantimonas sp. TaxID=2681568 RepID=UPI00391D2FCD
MLKFVKHHLATIDNVDIYPIISLILFGLVFIAILIKTFLADKNTMKQLSQMPLNDDPNSNPQN